MNSFTRSDDSNGWLEQWRRIPSYM